MPSSSSSDDEDLAKFREAADNTLYSDSLFTKKQDHNQGKEFAVIPPSLRNIDGDEDDKIHNELRVTPSFQKHVAKHLTKLLDSQLELNESSTEKTCNLSEKTRCILRAKRVKDLSDTATNSNGGVRLFGASAVFLSNMNIAPAVPHRRRKRGRVVASFSSGSESSSEDSDSDDKHKLSAAAVSSDWVLSGTAIKGWTNKQSKVESGIFSNGLSKNWMKKKNNFDASIANRPDDPVVVKDELSRGYESLNEMSYSNNNSKEVSMTVQQDDLAFLKTDKNKRVAHVESELAASFSSVVSIGSDSQGDSYTKSKKKKKKKKRVKKEHYSEDATTETTEVEDVIDDRRKKVKKGRKKPKRQRLEEKEAEELKVMKSCVPGLLDEDNYGQSLPKRKKKKRRDKAKREISFLKERQHKHKHKLSKILKPGISKKKMSKKVLHLSEDLAKLMMNSHDTSSS